MRRSKRARNGQSKSSTSSVLAALKEEHVSIAHEIAQIAALEAELNALNVADLNLVTSLGAVLDEETESLNQSALKSKERIQEISIEHSELIVLLSEVRHDK